MKFELFVVLLVQLVVFSTAAPTDCDSQFNVTKQDWADLKKDTANPPEKILCVLKCEYEASGAIKSDKTIDAEILVNKITVWKNLDKSISDELRTCVQKNAIPVNTCLDLKPYYMCVRTAEMEQDSKTPK